MCRWLKSRTFWRSRSLTQPYVMQHMQGGGVGVTGGGVTLTAYIHCMDEVHNQTDSGYIKLANAATISQKFAAAVCSKAEIQKKKGK